MASGGPKRLTESTRRLGFPPDWYLIPVGALIGTLTAFGALGFQTLLHEVERLATHTRVAWPLGLLPALPMLGALVSGLLVWRFAGEARGHGVPQVMKAIIQRNGRIPLRVGVVKVFASICTVGSGGSAGTEGPIVQIGATAGSALSRLIKIPVQHQRTLVGCGAAAGIASIFNAPIAGVLFVLEILLRDFSIRIFTPIVIASVFSAATTHTFVGENVAIFDASALQRAYEFSAVELPSYVVLGVLCGLVAVFFNWLLHRAEDAGLALPVHAALKPVLGALLLGGLGIAYLSIPGVVSSGNTPSFFGNGYPTILHLLDPTSYPAGTAQGAPVPIDIWLLGLLVLLKTVATCFTLGSGGSGGVFAPSLFLGAVAGAALGVALRAAGLLPEGGSPAPYALVGMAAVVAGSTHAPLTAILILYELTRDEYVLLPIMLAAVIATIVSQIIQRDSIYTYKLRREGVLVGAARDLTILRRLRVADVEAAPLPPEQVYLSDPLSKLVSLHAYHHVPDFPVVDQTGHYVGMVTGADMRTALIDREAIPLLLVAEIVRADIPTVRELDTLDVVMQRFAKHDVSGLCVTRPDPADPEGPGFPVSLVTRARVMERYNAALAEA